MKNLVYLAVTADKYELPLALFENTREACDWSGKSLACFRSAICRKAECKRYKCKFVTVKLNNDEEEQQTKEVNN